MATTPEPAALPPAERRIYCNRTLNLRAIRAVGYDMDYTLVHYHVEAWERRAYASLRERLVAIGLPASDLEFDPELVARGLIVDTERGNLVKANRFGYVTRSCHGTAAIDFEAQRRIYGRTLVDLGDARWTFLNTLFSLSEACMYAQLVDRLDESGVGGPVGYADLYRQVRAATDEAHLEGELKDEIAADPDRYVARDPEVALALVDQREAGKRLLLITNSDWTYTDRILTYSLEPFLNGKARWRDLFEVVMVSARKPEFFTRRMPAFEIVSEDGLLRLAPGGIRKPGRYAGGDATQVETYLGVSGDEILYIGDHIYVDVHVTKSVLRWRTALILRELEEEIAALEGFRSSQAELGALMEEKTRLEREYSRARLELQRRQAGYGPTPSASARGLRARMAELREAITALDERVAPLARQGGEIANRRWGVLMRAGNDKSHLARQVEGYADIYTSRVSNFVFETPFGYLRAPRGSLPHDDAKVLS